MPLSIEKAALFLPAASVSANGGWIGRLMPGAAKAGFRCFKYAVLSIYLWRCMEGGFMFTHQEKVKERRFSGIRLRASGILDQPDRGVYPCRFGDCLGVLPVLYQPADFAL